MYILVMDDDKVAQILSWEGQMPASEKRQPTGSLGMLTGPEGQWALVSASHEGLLQSCLLPSACGLPLHAQHLGSPEHDMSSQDLKAPP